MDSQSFYECLLTNAVWEEKLVAHRDMSPSGHSDRYSFKHHTDCCSLLSVELNLHQVQ